MCPNCWEELHMVSSVHIIILFLGSVLTIGGVLDSLLGLAFKTVS